MHAAHAARICDPHTRRACATRLCTDGRTDGLRADAYADRRNLAATLRADARDGDNASKDKPMTSPTERAVAAIIRILVTAAVDGADPDHTARQIMTGLAGH